MRLGFLRSSAAALGAVTLASSAMLAVPAGAAKPPALQLTVGNSVAEGGPGAKTPFPFTVNLSKAVAHDVSFDAWTEELDDFAAKAGVEFETLKPTRFTIPAGSTSLTINVNVLGDKRIENDEGFRLRIGNADGGTIAKTGMAVATVWDDDTELNGGQHEVTIDDVTVKEKTGREVIATFKVRIHQPATKGPVKVKVFTKPGTALPGKDYRNSSRTVTIPRYKLFTNFTVKVMGDKLKEATETFVVHADGSNLFHDDVGVGTIIDND